MADMRLLGEAYNYMLLDSRTLFELLYACMSHGHDSAESAARLDPPDDFFRVRMVRGTLPAPCACCLLPAACACCLLPAACACCLLPGLLRAWRWCSGVMLGWCSRPGMAYSAAATCCF